MSGVHNMAAFEKAVGFLGNDKRFAEFVKLRDPLLSGEEARFLRLVPGAEKPRLPESADVIIRELHHVPMKHAAAYLAFMKNQGLGTLKKHGFRPVGPFIVEVGKWSEITYLFRFKSLSERERLRATFQAHPDSKTYGGKLGQFVNNLTTRVLLSAPFAKPKKAVSWKPMTSPLLPHLTEVVASVYAAGFAHRHRSANCGWVALSGATTLIDLPRGVDIPQYLKVVAETAGNPADRLVLTSFQASDAEIVQSLVKHGIKKVVTSTAIGKALIDSKPLLRKLV